MNTLMRSVVALCTLLMLGLGAPAFAQKATLSTADPQVCCSAKDAAGNLIFFYAPKSQCPKNQVVGLERCKKRPLRSVCCKLPNGQLSILRSDRCKAAGGNKVEMKYCKRNERKICCRTPNGFYSWTPAMCRKANGTIVNAKYCRTRHICCRFTGANGNVVHDFLTPKVCKAYKGTHVSNHYCLRAAGDLKLRRN